MSLFGSACQFRHRFLVSQRFIVGIFFVLADNAEIEFAFRLCAAWTNGDPASVGKIIFQNIGFCESCQFFRFPVFLDRAFVIIFGTDDIHAIDLFRRIFSQIGKDLFDPVRPGFSDSVKATWLSSYVPCSAYRSFRTSTRSFPFSL